MKTETKADYEKLFEVMNEELTERKEKMELADRLVLEVIIMIENETSDRFTVMAKLAEIQSVLG